jgi:hypothetical protein
MHGDARKRGSASWWLRGPEARRGRRSEEIAAAVAHSQRTPASCCQRLLDRSVAALGDRVRRWLAAAPIGCPADVLPCTVDGLVSVEEHIRSHRRVFVGLIAAIAVSAGVPVSAAAPGAAVGAAAPLVSSWAAAVALHGVLEQQLLALCGSPQMRRLPGGGTALACAGGYAARARRYVTSRDTGRVGNLAAVPAGYGFSSLAVVDPRVLTPPARLRRWSAGFLMDPGATRAPNSLSAIACPSTGRCTAVDAFGDEVTFDPRRAAGARLVRIDGSIALIGVSCPTLAQCTATDALGNELTFDPGRPRARNLVSIDPAGAGLWSIDCRSQARCMAVDGLGNAVTFNPRKPAGATPIVVDPGGGGLEDVSCPRSSRCVAVDFDGNVLTFDPMTPRVAAARPVDPTGHPTALACFAVSRCTTVDTAGNEVSFDPTGPAGAAAIAIDPGGGGLTGISCPSARRCTAVDLSGREVTFDPTAPSAPTPVLVDLNGHGMSSIACPSPRHCTAVDLTGDEVTFTPLSRPGPHAGRLPEFPQAVDDAAALVSPAMPGGGGSNTTAVSCVSDTQCTAVDPEGYEVTANPESPGAPVTVKLSPRGEGMYGLSCPTRHQCTAVGGQYEVTFDPTDPGTPTAVQIDRRNIDNGGMLSVACPSLSQCSAVDLFGQVTIDPRNPAAQSHHALSSVDLQSVACPTRKQCTALRYHGLEVTFDPASGRILAHFAIARGTRLTALSCPTIRQCTAVGSIPSFSNPGEQVTFDPLSARTSTRFVIGNNDNPSAVVCLSRRRCTAVDTAGNIITFDPRSQTRPAPISLDPGNELTQLACTADQCLAVDWNGEGFAGPAP